MFFLSHGTLWQRKKITLFYRILEDFSTYRRLWNRAELWFYKDDYNSRSLLFHARRD